MAFHELWERRTGGLAAEFYHVDADHPQYVMQHHWHREPEIIRILSGTLTIMLNEKEITAGRGDMVVVNSEIVHGGVPNGCVYECIVFNPEKLICLPETESSFVSGLLSHDTFIFHRLRQEEQPAFFDAATRLFEAFAEDGEGSELMILSRFYELFAVIRRERLYSGNLAYRDFLSDKNVLKLKRAISYIQTHYDHTMSLAELAQEVGVSSKYLCAFFKEMTGLSPFEYLNIYRIERAAAALLTTDAPITQIAYACGFNDLSYFIKTFKAHKGSTPRNFRKKKPV